MTAAVQHVIAIAIAAIPHTRNCNGFEQSTGSATGA